MDLHDAGQDPVRAQLIALRNGLLRLHKTALDSERAIYERDIERIRSSGHFLELVLHDPWFAWLRPLSRLMAGVDEAMDGKEPLTRKQAEDFLKEARELLKLEDPVRIEQAAERVVKEQMKWEQIETMVARMTGCSGYPSLMARQSISDGASSIPRYG